MVDLNQYPDVVKRLYELVPRGLDVVCLWMPYVEEFDF